MPSWVWSPLLSGCHLRRQRCAAPWGRDSVPWVGCLAKRTVRLGGLGYRAVGWVLGEAHRAPQVGWGNRLVRSGQTCRRLSDVPRGSPWGEQGSILRVNPTWADVRRATLDPMRPVPSPGTGTLQVSRAGNAGKSLTTPFSIRPRPDVGKTFTAPAPKVCPFFAQKSNRRPVLLISAAVLSPPLPPPPTSATAPGSAPAAPSAAVPAWPVCAAPLPAPAAASLAAPSGPGPAAARSPGAGSARAPPAWQLPAPESVAAGTPRPSPCPPASERPTVPATR